MKNLGTVAIVAGVGLGISMAWAIAEDANDGADGFPGAIVEFTMPGLGDPEVIAEFNNAFVPLVLKNTPTSGIFIAKYRMESSSPGGGSIEAFAGYDIATHASFFVSSWTGEFFITNPEGEVWRGRLTDEPDDHIIAYHDEFPLDNTRVEQFFPTSYLLDIIDRPELVTSVGPRVERVKQDDGTVVEEIMPGMQATIVLPVGRRYADRRRPGALQQPVPVTITVDDAGRFLWYSRGGARPYKFEYLENGPADFPIAFRQNGANWNVAEWEHLNNQDAADVFSPAFVVALTQLWGIQPALTHVPMPPYNALPEPSNSPE